MNKRILGIFVIILSITCSCKKTAYTNPQGSWSLNSGTYNSDTFVIVGTRSFYASTLSSGVPSTSAGIQFYFDTTVTAGTYTVTNHQWSGISKEVYIILSSGGTSPVYYNPTGGNGSNQTITVAMIDGKYHVTGSGIEMYTASNSSDSSVLNFDIIQTQ